MDVGRSLGFVFSDPKWLKKILLAAFVMAVPILGQFIMGGWLLDTLRNIRAKQQYPMPDWSGDELARWMGRGVASTIAVMAWVLPCVLVLGLIFTCGSFGLQTAGLGGLGALSSGGRGGRDLAAGLGSALSLVSCCLACLGVLSLLIIVLGSMVPYIRFAATDQIDVGLDYRTNFSLLFSHIGPFLLVIVMLVLAAVVAGLVNAITCGIGTFVTIPYLGLVVTCLYADLSQLIDKSQPAPAASVAADQIN